MPSVAEYMSPAPPFVEAGESLWAAERIMRDFGLHQLPVVTNEGLCGVLTARDTRAMCRLIGSDDGLTVGQAMSADFYVVRPATPLVHVLRTMASHDYFCALVVEDEVIKGILTNAQALDSVAQILEREYAAGVAMAPSETRAVILTEHSHVQMLLRRTRAAAHAVQLSPAPDHSVEKLHDSARHLVLAIGAHIQLEDRVLAPALARLPGYGHERAAEMVAEHRPVEQTFLLLA
jgi:hypothetical protein